MALFFCVDNNTFDIYSHMDDIRAERRWWWMDRNNNFRDVPSEGHYVWAQRFLAKIKYPVHPNATVSGIYYLMYRMGFIRVGIIRFGTEDAQIVYEYDPKNPPDYHKIDLIKQLGIEHGVKWITDGMRNKKDRIMEGKLTSKIKKIITRTIKEAMFPKDFKRHNLGTCMSAAAMATSYFLSKGIKNFKIVEGWVSMYPDQEENEWSAHTWIEFDNGRKFDPTKKQWEKWGFKTDETKYERVTRTFTPEQYIKLCRIQGDIDEAYHSKFDTKMRGQEDDLYFSIGQEDEENTRNSWCWIWDKVNQSVKAAKGHTHSMNFGGPTAKDYTYSGWYDPEKNAISFVFPAHELRKFGDRRPTVDDIPQQVYQKLLSKFNTTNPRFVIFEVVQKDIKPNINIPPERMRYDDKGNLRLDLLTLDNLKALRDKADRSWRYWIKHQDSNNTLRAMEAYKRYDAEIKRRVQYINKRIKENADEHEWRAWWMEPSGILHEVYKGSNNYGHWKFAKDYVIRHGLVDKELADGLCVMILMDKGWVRLTFNYYRDGALHFDKSKTRPVNERTMAEIKSLAIELGASKLIDDNLNKDVSLLQENMTYDELLTLTSKTPRSPEDNTNRIDRSKTVAARSLPVTVEEDGEQWNFRYKSSPQSTVTNEPFEGHITFLKGEVGRNDDATQLECKVDCGCPDYMYKFAFNNYAKGAGDIGPDSENNAINRRPKPAYDIGEGLCKHLVALSKYLQTKVAATRKPNVFQAMDEVAKQGPFNITYQD